MSPAARGLVARWSGPASALTIAAVAAAAVAGAVLAVLGYDVGAAGRALLDGAFGGRQHANLYATLGRAAPIVGLGVAIAVALRGGFLNLGGEGQLVLGALAAAVVGTTVPVPAVLNLPLALGVGALAGGVYGLLAQELQIRFAVPTLVGTLLLNAPAGNLGAYLATRPLRDPASGLAQTIRLPDAMQLPRLGRLDLVAPIVLVATLAVAWIIARTRAGWTLRTAGANPAFATSIGLDLERIGRRAMFASGAGAGGVGALMVLAVHHRFIDGALTTPRFAWIGLMAALLAGARPLGVLICGLILAAIATGGYGMERHAGVPRELSLVLQALIILFVAAAGRFGLGEGRRP